VNSANLKSDMGQSGHWMVRAVKDLERDAWLVHRRMRPLRKRPEGIENVGPRLAAVIEGLINDLSDAAMCATM